jgi:hypothetical protein
LCSPIARIISVIFYYSNIEWINPIENIAAQQMALQPVEDLSSIGILPEI